MCFVSSVKRGSTNPFKGTPRPNNPISIPPVFMILREGKRALRIVLENKNAPWMHFGFVATWPRVRHFPVETRNPGSYLANS